MINNLIQYQCRFTPFHPWSHQMPNGSWKKTTDLIVTSVREQMMRLKTYYQHMGSCWDCKKKLAFYDFDLNHKPGGWKIAHHVNPAKLQAAQLQARTVPVCIACHDRRSAA